ncbi:MAG: DUF4157 domain-containing protein [Enhygromyxa sp.]
MAFAFTTRKPQLQQIVGRRPFAAAPIQPKLEIGSVNDPLEREADAVADAVMRQPLGSVAVTETGSEQISRACASCSAEEDPLQAKPEAGGLAPAGPSFDSRLASSREHGGTPMSPHLRTTMEQRFGADFGGVRLHTDDSSATLARQINARAFTTGNDVFFGRGQYQPESSEGQRLLAHELTHTIQQRGRTDSSRG